MWRAFLKKSQNRSTVHDVANAAGVSSATASRVLSGSDYPVNERTRRRILEASEKLDYKPNLIGQMLKKSAAHDIGIILPNISNPFYTEFVLGAETAAKSRNFGLLLCNTLRSETREYEYLETLCQKQVGGVILSSVAAACAPIKRLCDRYGLKVMALDQSLSGVSLCLVDFQVRRAAQMAVRYLFDCGHRRIALVTSPPKLFSRKEVLRGFRDGVASCDIPAEDAPEIASSTERELLRGEVYEFENGKLLADKVLALSPAPSALLCVNDITAAGVIQRLHERGVRVPEDISVMGMDNIALARMISPALTTVDQYPFEAGLRAANALLDAVTTGRKPEKTIEIEPRIVNRASVQEKI